MATNPADGKIYGFWRKGAETTATYKLIRFEGSRWATVGSFSMADVGFFNSASDDVSLAIDATGRFHVAFKGSNTIGPCCDSERGVGYGTSTNGTSWAFTKIQTYSDPRGYKNTDDPIVELDGANRPHIVFLSSDANSPRTYTLRYFQFNGTSWSGQDAFSQQGGSPASNEINSFDFALDGTGKAHIAFQRETSGQGRDGGLWYVTNASGSWASPVVLAAGVQDQEQGESIGIDIDAANKVNIVHSNYQGNLYFVTNASGSFSNSQINGNLTGSVRPHDFKINSNGDRFVLNGGKQYAYLLAGTTGNWTTGTAYTTTAGVEAGTFPSGLLASDGRIMLLYDYKSSGSCGPQNPRNLYYATTVIAIPATPGLVSSITAPSSGPTNAASISFTVTFTKTITGGNASNFSLTTTGSIGGASISSVTGSGATRTVVVNSGTGSGTIRLNVVNATGLSPSVTNLPYTTGATVTVDKTGPSVSSVSIPANGTYRAGQILSFTVNYNENLSVTGTPNLPLTIGGTQVQAGYSSGNGTNALTFRYTVLAGQQDTDGIMVGSTLGLNGGTLNDGAGNNASLTLSGVGNTAGVRVDAVAPTVGISSTAGATGGTTTASPIPVTVSFSEAVTGFVAGDLTVTNGAVSGFSGSGTAYSFNVIPTASGMVTVSVPANVAQDAATNGNTAAIPFAITYTPIPTIAGFMATPSAVCLGSPLTLIATVGNLSGSYAYTLSNGSTIHTGTSASTAFRETLPGSETGVQSVSLVVSSSGQRATATTSVTVNEPPVAGLTNNGPLTCAQTSVTLTASGGSAYRFSAGATPSGSPNQALVNASGTYSVTVTNASGCTASQSTTVFSNTTAPAATLTASSTAVCAPTSITLTAGGGVSYTFSPGATQIGMTSQAVVTQSGTYTVTAAGVNGCTSTADITLAVNPLPNAPSLSGESRSIIQSNTPRSLLDFVTADNGNTLSFSGLNGLLNPPTVDISQTGELTFQVTQTNTSGCTSPSTPFSLTILPSIPANQTVCRSSPLVLTSITPGNRYEWYKNGTAAPFKLTEIASIQRGTKTASLTLVSPQTTAPYYLKIFAADGSFVFEGPFKVVVDYSCVATGARQAAPELVQVPLSVVLLPNPIADGQVRAVVRGAGGQFLRVSLLNMQGHPVGEQHWSVAEGEQALELPLGGYPSGLYLLQVQTPGQRRVVKVIKP